MEEELWRGPGPPPWLQQRVPQWEPEPVEDKEYLLALKDGSSLVSYVGVMIAGYGGVGKTSLLFGLKRKPLPDFSSSTLMANLETIKYNSERVSRSAWASSSSNYWKDVSEEDEYMEMAQLILDVYGNKMSDKEMVRSSNPDLFGVHIPHIDDAQELQTEDYKYQHKNVQDIVEKVMLYTKTSMTIERKSEIWMRVWDCGGQRVFRTVLPAFITSKTMFILMFDSRQYLNKQCISTFNFHGKVEVQNEGITSLELLLQWMATIHSSLSKKKISASNFEKSPVIPVENQREYKDDKSLFIDYPRIIIVGTHGDSEIVNRNKEKIIDSVYEACESKAFANIVEKCVIVDNTTAGGQEKEEDPSYDIIRKKIFSFGKELGFRTPISWILFRKVLSQLSKEKPVVNFSELHDILRACKIPPHSIFSILRFYHNFGVFFHYSHILSLKDKVITNPHWLVKVIGSLFCLKGSEPELGKPFMWTCLQKYGILVEPLYVAVLKQQKFLEPAEIIDLLEDFLIIAEIHTQSKKHCFTGKEYFVPSMLQLGKLDRRQRKEFIYAAEPLHLTFSTKYLPPGFFTRFAALLSKNLKFEIKFDENICSNRIKYAYGKLGQRRDEITISEHITSVRIDVIRFPSSVKAPTSVNDEEDFRNVCIGLLDIFKSCSKEVLKWLQEIDMSFAIRCLNCGIEECHFVVLPTSFEPITVLMCENDHIFVPNNGQEFWITIWNAHNCSFQQVDWGHQTPPKQQECQPHISANPFDTETTTTWTSPFMPPQISSNPFHNLDPKQQEGQPHISTNPFDTEKETATTWTSPFIPLQISSNPFHNLDSKQQECQPHISTNSFDTETSTTWTSPFMLPPQISSNPFQNLASAAQWGSFPVSENSSSSIDNSGTKPNQQFQQISTNPFLDSGNGFGHSDVTLLSVNDLDLVVKELYNARNEWVDIGLALGIHMSTLDEFRNTDVRTCFRRMLQEWLQNGLNTRWRALADALGRKTVRHAALKNTILEKYCT